MATGYTATWGRREFADWLAVDLAAGELFDDLVLIAYETLANTADHAYTHTAGGTGPVRLLARRSHDTIQITVSDHGIWHQTPDNGFRGHGLALIRLLIHDVHIELRSTGTIVHLRTPLPPPTA